MARTRYIKPDFFEDETIGEITPLARLLYIGLWCFMDRQGVAEGGIKQIKRNVFGYDDAVTVQTIEDLLLELEKSGRLIRFVYENKPYLFSPKFKLHQRCHPGEEIKYPISEEKLLEISRNCNAVTSKPLTLTLTSTLTSTLTKGRGIRGQDLGSPSEGAIAPQSGVGTFIGVYVKSYQSRYGERARPSLGGKVQGQVRRFLADTPTERACEMIRAFCQMDDAWFLTKAHDFGTFLENLNKVSLKLDTGYQTTRTQIQNVEKTSTVRSQLERIKAGEL